MAELRFTKKAIIDLNSIWEYAFNKWSERQADKYYKELILCCEKLAKNPELGKHYFGENPKIIGFHKNKHIIFYAVIGSDIEVIRILHERMDILNRLTD